MAENNPFRKNVRRFYAWLGATLLAFAAPLVASRMVDSQDIGARIGGVLVGTLAWIPLVVVVFMIIRQGDEFIRRIHLVAISCAFGGALLMITLLDWLTRANFIKQPSLSLLWLLIAMLWFISLMLSKRYFERQT